MDSKTKPMFTAFLILSGALAMFMIYYEAYPFWAGLHLSAKMTDALMLSIYKSGLMRNWWYVRAVILFFCTYSVIVRSGSSKEAQWQEIALPIGLGLALFFGGKSAGNGLLYVVMTTVGYGLYLLGNIALGRAINAMKLATVAKENDTFPQCERLIQNRFSINIPTTYQNQGRLRRGYINVVNPFRGTMVIGTPGSGKTVSVYGPYIRQMIQKGYSLFVYDYKYPDLTQLVMNELLDNYICYGDNLPQMYVVNFDDPLYSHRFNPIHPRYLQDPIDATEIAEVIMKNANRENARGEDFFSLSARCYVDMLIWFLRIYEGGRYCTFPHLIELMGQNYKHVLLLMERYQELDIKRNTFQDAITDKAFEQLQGQIASARVPLNRFASETLYWALSGDDFDLQINDPDHPKIVCVGNNPARQQVYGTTLAMLMSQLFKIINRPKMRRCGILIDELPTIYLKGLDHLINTARSNHVAVVLGAQDKSQLVKDYDKKESDVIFNTVGNVFAGAVKGDTAESLSKSFGKTERETRSYQESDTSEHVTYSYQLRDVLPASRIEALSQGSFCGYVADEFRQKINPKIFCGEIKAGKETTHKEEVPQVVDTTKEMIQEQVRQNYERIRTEVYNLLYTELNTPKEGATPEPSS